MCLIVLKNDKTSIFTEEQFEKMIWHNSDGLGIMYKQGARVIAHKTVGNDKEKLKLWKKFADLPSYAMHARFKTHGKIDVDNCHPYEVMNKDKGDPLDLYMMHNGTISNTPDTDRSMSDTWNFVANIIKPLAKLNPDIIWDSEVVQIMIHDFIGAGNKLLFMSSSKPNVLIFNKEKGSDRTGCWLSNLISQPVQTTRIVQYKPKDMDKCINWWRADEIKEQEIKNDNTTHQWKEGDAIKKEPAKVTREGKFTDKEMHTHFAGLLGVLKLGINDKDIIPILREEPDLYARMIMHFYDGNCVIKHEAIISEIEDDTKVKDVISLIKNLKDNGFKEEHEIAA